VAMTEWFVNEPFQLNRNGPLHMNCVKHLYAYFSMINLVTFLFVIVIAINIVIVIAINIKNTFKTSIYSPVLSGDQRNVLYTKYKE
jgi:hypothetical protein